MKHRTISAVIIDDEQDAISFLKAQLARTREELRIAAFTDPVAALEFPGWRQQDLLFLDVEMPAMNGFELLDQLGVFQLQVVFTTAFEHYAIDALKRGAVDYLLKPVKLPELHQAIESIEEKLIRDTVDPIALERICVPTSNGFELIELSKLLWLQSSNNYTYLHVLDQSKPLLISRPLRAFERKLQNSHFMRVNQSVIVNLHYVRSFDKRNGGSVFLDNNKEFTLGQTYRNRFITSFSLLKV